MGTYSVQHLSFSSIKHRNLLFSAARVFTSTRGVPADRAVRQLVISSTQHLKFRVKLSMATPKVHPTAQNGFGAGTNELYDRARPSYQPVVLSHIRTVVGESKKDLNVVELGSGTGIFTRALLAHPGWSTSVAKLKAVEPSEGMRDQFSKSVTDPRVSVGEGTFDHTNVEDGWADLIVIAQAFHWCPDHEAALKEFARVLKPDGVVVLTWNLENRDVAGWVAELRDVYEKYEKGTPQFRLGLWRAVFNAPSYPELFQPSDEKEFAYILPATADIVADRVCSKSYIAIESEETQAQVRGWVKDILKKGDGLVWIDEKEGVFEYPYKTYVVALKRK